MKILAIETSCDETGIALVEGTKTNDGFAFEVLRNALLSQAELHAEYGGVYPNLAKREHQKNLPILFTQFERDEFEAVAVTRGPGLEPALWTGITFAEKLAQERSVPLFPINHMEGHLVSSLTQSGKLEKVAFPVLALLISGGHTEFILMKDWFEYELVGETQDDAVGEAFDKVARMLSLGYPGGPQISKFAAMARKSGWQSDIVLPRPMIGENSCDMSFSGLKTAALYALRDRGGIQALGAEQIAAFAREFEDAVTDVLVSKAKRALESTGAQTFVLGGGVAANTHLRETFAEMIQKEFPEVEFRLPHPSITGDNAIMIAEAALVHSLSGHAKPAAEPLVARGNLSLSEPV
jgi:N6-L-threonylcarbamoyladenine synthase